MTVCYQEWDGTAFHPAPGSKRSSQLHKMYQSRCTGKNSWWWAERLPETCRVVIPIKLEFSASVGLIHKETTLSNFMIICPVGAEFHADGQTDRMKLTVDFRRFANESKNRTNSCARPLTPSHKQSTSLFLWVPQYLMKGDSVAQAVVCLAHSDIFVAFLFSLAYTSLIRLFIRISFTVWYPNLLVDISGFAFIPVFLG